MPARPCRAARARVLLAGTGTALLAALAVPVHAVAATSTPADPYAHGSIGLCDIHGRPLTVGSVTTTPFTWTAVSSVAAPAQYRGAGENTALEVYQVRTGVDPTEWSGDTLTAASYYRVATVPVAQATAADIPLSTVIAEYPPEDGLYELRLQFARNGYGIDSTSYPATMIRVQGDVWSVVDPHPVDCGAGTATSNEVMVGVADARPPADGPVAGAVSLPAAGGWTATDSALTVLGVVAVGATGAVVTLTRRRRRRTPPVRPVRPTTLGASR